MAMLESPPQLALVPHAALGGDCCYGGQQQQQQQQQASSSGVVVAVAVAEAARPGEGGEGVAVGAARPVAKGTKRASGTRPPRASGTRKRASGARAPRAGGEGAAKSSAAGGSAKPARSSRYRGVAQHKVTRRWESHIWHDKRQCYLGSFDTEEDAAVAYDQGALRLKGREKAALNFPERDYSEFERETQGMGAEEAIAHLRRASSGFCRGQAKYRGVSFRPATKRWEARMSGITSRKYTYLGTYDSAAEAAAAYDRAAIACKGKEAMTNFAISNYSEELGALAAASKSSLRSNDGRPSRATVAALNAMSADYFDKEAERKRKVAASTPESARKRRRRQAEERKRAGIARGAGAFGAFGGINRDGGAFRLQESPRRGHAHGLESQQQAGELHAGGGLVHNPFGGSAGANVLQPSARVNLNAAFDQGGNPASPRRLLSYSSAPPPYQQLLAATLPILGSPVAPHGGMPFTQAHVAATLLLTPPGHGDPVTDENRGPLSANIIRHEGAGAHLGMPPGNAAAQAKAKRRSSIELFPAANAALHGPERDGNGVLPPSGSESPVPHLSDHSTGCGGGPAEMQQPSAFAEVSPIPVTPADHQPPHDRPGFGGDAQQGATNAGGSGRRGNACAAAAEQPVPVVWDELFQAGGGSGNAPQPGTARSAASAGDGGRADANANDSLRLPGDASLRSLRSLQSLRHLSSSFQESQFSKLFPRESSKSLMMGVDATAFEETLRVWQDNADEMKTPLPGQRASATNAATPGAPPAARQATSGARAGTQATGEDSTPAPTTAISGAHTNAKTPADLLVRPTPFRAVPSGRKLGAIPNADEIGSAVQAWGETPGALRTPSSLRDLLRVFEAEGTAAEERG